MQFVDNLMLNNPNYILNSPKVRLSKSYFSSDNFNAISELYFGPKKSKKVGPFSITAKECTSHVAQLYCKVKEDGWKELALAFQTLPKCYKIAQIWTIFAFKWVKPDFLTVKQYSVP